MPLFLIRRDQRGVSREELEAGAFRAASCTSNFEGMRWITSFFDVDGETVFCIYEAHGADDLREHASRARIPCDEVLPVVQLFPEDYGAPARIEGAAGANR
jgi:hypothetical protein